jgi:hypothetical protein
MWGAQKAGVQSQLRDLEAELREYESLKSGSHKTLEMNSLDVLPRVLIQARITAGLTQEELPSRLGVKP